MPRRSAMFANRKVDIEIHLAVNRVSSFPVLDIVQLPEAIYQTHMNKFPRLHVHPTAVTL